MPIRVIAGRAKGRKLKMVPGDSTRPVMDRVKEALFSILGTAIQGSTMLDLFAGTGSIGIEALSRGAQHVLFIDNDRMAIRTIHENLESTGLAAFADVLRTNAFEYLGRQSAEPFEFIYIAPPQYKGMWKEVLLHLDENPAPLAEDGIVIVQIDPDEAEDVPLRSLVLYDERSYGRTLLRFYELVSPEDEDQQEDKPPEDPAEA
ncbi:16S rRNA (guanine(966)-N(2))-methyltransferase RsmD [Aggregatilinea lenta]|uniref:16S rRNA (guanine(966)-N(2))-methyltransferase RsmD n=1 Tax=Aggregatilinea lenta TaxID=913108 RepID=UPI000E5B97FC|nr:16S rRNA (guanine(966)-N(2))-methyltransferase RsmD [Aggregatilinea lenta]